MTVAYIIRNLWSFPHILCLSVVVRVALILYSEWHDARSLVKYTDIDYRVFSDAAFYLLHPGPGNEAQGPLHELFGNVGEYVAVMSLRERSSHDLIVQPVYA